MKVAVITPYFNTPEEWLKKCHGSVMAQTYPCTHFMVSDGNPSEIVDSFNVQHIRLPFNHADFGDTPRCVGSILAIAQHFDAIAYLDADNWYYPDHIARLVKLHQLTGAAVITASRDLYRLDGTFLGKEIEDDGIRHVDTNCFLITRRAFRIVSVWSMLESLYEIRDKKLGENLHAIGDRLFWAEIKFRKLSHTHLSKPTVAYRTAFIHHYLRFNEKPPEEAKSGSEVGEAFNKFRQEAKMGRIKRL